MEQNNFYSLLLEYGCYCVSLSQPPTCTEFYISWIFLNLTLTNVFEINQKSKKFVEWHRNLVGQVLFL